MLFALKKSAMNETIRKQRGGNTKELIQVSEIWETELLLLIILRESTGWGCFSKERKRGSECWFCDYLFVSLQSRQQYLIH